MICCTLLAGLLALLTRLWPVQRANPLAWRPAAGAAESGEVPRAHSRLRSFAHAFAGLRFAVRTEPNMRIHLVAATSALFAGVWLALDAAEWRWLVLAVALVLIAEALNTAVEQACNAVTRRFDPAIKAAKDVTAGAVLIAAAAATLIGASVFLSHLAGSTPPPNRLCQGAI